jgi:two-component system cell cycle response regulator
MSILIADDDIVSRRLLQVSLTNAGYRVQLAVDGAEALRAFEQQDCPRLVVMDWMMPKMDGLEVCRAIRKLSPEPYIYIILLTSRGQQAEIIEGLEAGADDYITKPFDLQELKARVRAGMRILDLQEQIVSTREQLRIQATHDALTGLLNRRAILETLEKELARSTREGTQISVTMADLDHFKRVNDTYGHLAGDAVLRETAQRIQASMRVYDSVGRYGGEEFLVVSPGCGLLEAAEQAERLRKRISKEGVRVRDCAIPVTMSLGVVALTAELRQPGDLLRLADDALYAAKHGGRDRVEVNSTVCK